MYIQHKVMKMNPLFLPISRPEKEKVTSSENGQTTGFGPPENSIP